MDTFNIFILPSAEQEFRAVPFPYRRQINQRISRLKINPRPTECEHLSESERYRLAVHGWFVLYVIDDKKRLVTIWAVLSA